MNNSNYCPSPNEPSIFESDPLSERFVMQACDQEHSGEEMGSRQEKSSQHVENPKHTMESLCKSFINKYQNSSSSFEPCALAAEFNAKLRRVYDMTNILEGGGIIQKVEKSTYIWKGSEKDCKQYIVDRNDWCSLRNISNGLKNLFQSVKKGVTCHDLYEILTTGKQNKFNPATIRRRIYECCKVFLLVGLIQKSGKSFYNGKLTDKDIQLLMKRKIQDHFQNKISQDKGETMQIEARISYQSQIHRVETYKIDQKDLGQLSPIQQSRKSIIRKIVNQFKNQLDLYKFIQDLSFEFKSKNSTTDQDSQQQKFQETIQSPFTNASEQVNICHQRKTSESMYMMSPKNHRKNIIISSPLKENRMSFLSDKGSNFCSFPSSMMFANCSSSFSQSCDIKGK